MEASEGTRPRKGEAVAQWLECTRPEFTSQHWKEGSRVSGKRKVHLHICLRETLGVTDSPSICSAAYSAGNCSPSYNVASNPNTSVSTLLRAGASSTNAKDLKSSLYAWSVSVLIG